MDPVTLYNPADQQVVVVTVPAEETRLRAAGYREAPPFDPSQHTVAEVQKHLAEHPGDADRVLIAEQGGRNRVQLTGGGTPGGEPGGEPPTA